MTIYKARAVYVGDRRTTVRLAPVMWEALEDISRRQLLPMAELLQHIEEDCDPGEGLADAIRIYIVKFYQSFIKETCGDRPKKRRTLAPPSQRSRPR